MSEKVNKTGYVNIGSRGELRKSFADLFSWSPAAAIFIFACLYKYSKKEYSLSEEKRLQNGNEHLQARNEYSKRHEKYSRSKEKYSPSKGEHLQTQKVYSLREQ